MMIYPGTQVIWDCPENLKPEPEQVGTNEDGLVEEGMQVGPPVTFWQTAFRQEPELAGLTQYEPLVQPTLDRQA